MDMFEDFIIEFDDCVNELIKAVLSDETEEISKCTCECKKPCSEAKNGQNEENKKEENEWSVKVEVSKDFSNNIDKIIKSMERDDDFWKNMVKRTDTPKFIYSDECSSSRLAYENSKLKDDNEKLKKEINQLKKDKITLQIKLKKVLTFITKINGETEEFKKFIEKII